ncbi:MAG: hypothetical protein H6Q76_1557 [Firmicutes bacterium]|nr:hypothetical protein [Bacillota bacterium]
MYICFDAVCHASSYERWKFDRKSCRVPTLWTEVADGMNSNRVGMQNQTLKVARRNTDKTAGFIEENQKVTSENQ